MSLKSRVTRLGKFRWFFTCNWVTLILWHRRHMYVCMWMSEHFDCGTDLRNVGAIEFWIQMTFLFTIFAILCM
jgi:hypothetical protein